MRRSSSSLLPYVVIALGLAAGVQIACSGNNSNSGFGGDDSGAGSSSGGSGSSSGTGSSSGGSGSSSGGSGSGSGGLVGDGSSPMQPEGSTTVMTTVYAHTDDTLYSVNPMNPSAVTMIGPMVGTSDSSTDSTITDLAVDGNGDVYVNSESVVYKAILPAGGTGTVMLQKVTAITGTSRFYALAFAPAGALDANNETLVGGDSNGSLWSINTSTGTTVNLGNFGVDPSTSGNTLELSGDIVFYLDAKNTPTGLATIRSCPTGGSSSKCGADFLAGVNMANLKTAYMSGTAATTLLGGVYGGSGNSLGAGTGYHDVFGLAAWNSTIFGFTRHTSTQANPMLITIDTTSGAGTMVSGTSFSFTNGWSGAGVTTKVTITAPPPPPPPAQ
jgi:hypothetical protein